ncbi:OmpA family protein [Sulfurimonas sp.]|uniref:OmpA family protein n=1 Tax=Sulfurimonas sp. TaxID=2022749 RepID=UPI0025EA5E67|nr:OmpA family protein [Sulfurimonas sp.]MBW6489206.1 OmpA family protein [Sulfurimonas sp.]
MKKLLLIPALLFSSALIAQDYNYEVTPVIGYNIAEGNLDLENQTLFGAEFQYNGCDMLLKPEISILYADADYENSPIGTDIYRIAINGVHEYDAIGMFTPLSKIGVGYETIDKHLADNKEGVFFDVGVGAKIPFTDAIALKLEAIYMLKNNDNRWDNNLALLAGINFAFGPKAVAAVSAPAPAPVDGDDDDDGVKNSVDKCPATPFGRAVDAHGCCADGDDDNDGVLNSKDLCPTTEYVRAVDTDGCCIDGDDDQDGVLNSVDKCPTTPKGSVVDSAGCTKIVNLHINFETASYTIDEASKPNVEAFADFLKARSNFDAKIIGHTDSVGSVANNQKLSDNRANRVKEMLVEYGIEAHRITTEGMGESAPTATNDTADGRAQNRRIEAELIKK